jgi:hypothetical protein
MMWPELGIILISFLLLPFSKGGQEGFKRSSALIYSSTSLAPLRERGGVRGRKGFGNRNIPE